VDRNPGRRASRANRAIIVELSLPATALRTADPGVDRPGAGTVGSTQLGAGAGGATVTDALHGYVCPATRSCVAIR